MVVIDTHTHKLSDYNKTVPRNINPYAQWLSQHIRPVAVSMHTASGNINTVPRIINSYAQW